MNKRSVELSETVFRQQVLMRRFKNIDARHFHVGSVSVRYVVALPICLSNHT